MKSHNRKLRRVVFSGTLPMVNPEPLNGRWFRFEGLPEDAELVAFGPDYLSNSFFAMIWSETFESVPEGEMIPELYPTFMVRVDSK